MDREGHSWFTRVIRLQVFFEDDGESQVSRSRIPTTVRDLGNNTTVDHSRILPLIP
jgi:hypothetical protein